MTDGFRRQGEEGVKESVKDRIVPASRYRETAQEGISSDGIDRRGFLKCMAWAGTGMVWSFVGGVPFSHALGRAGHAASQADFSFVQISDSHIGFNKPANTDVTATLQAALDRIGASPTTP